ncbi:hypothetical protein [Thauera linaloolentis]|uniref:Uncharacterized protein n=1 Tax=Thauera linaloolentis (strain DSM 12138 / JCM 21573 / CCUG 41526 / CIP 105981 / IAM 15112 / NBRC 102519 / 47Lol) TaxID=1123367 RepID=N6YZA4_THAL4|nr:hypothetical protein [Thauera linaloolentis]ENO87727.1 hypothetical protein C666_10320 [Thauera linaloolentis 47Lol = DSM 12138]MCM8567593.1 hypothetical protein [Thauera linaloolentis]
MYGIRVIVLLAAAGLAQAAEPAGGAKVGICYNYGCAREGVVRYAAAELDGLAARLDTARTAAEERALLGEAVGRLYRLAGGQIPVGADRSGNYLDGGADGRMDCIDHSTSTTRLLKLLESRGALRFHRVGEPERRTWFILQHFSAVIEELTLAERLERLPPGSALARCNCTEDGLMVEGPEGEEAPGAGERYAVDSWFVDNGEAAVVLPLAEWLNGGGPNVQ